MTIPNRFQGNARLRGIIYILAWVYFFSLGPVHGQLHNMGSPVVRNFFKTDYKAGTQNWAMVQDERGTLYMGNNKGILEFDGNEWQVYPLPNRTVVRSLALGEDNRLYVGGQDEFGFLGLGPDNKPTFISIAEKIPEEFQNFADVWQIFSIGPEIVFCTTQHLFSWNGSEVQVISSKTAFLHFFQVKDTIFIQDEERNLLVLKNGMLETRISSELIDKAEVAALLPYDGETLLAVTVHQGGFLIEKDKVKEWGEEVNSLLREFTLFSGKRITEERFALGTTSSGLLILKKDGTPVLHLDKSSGLQNNTVLCMFQDREKNLWLGLDNGIDHVAIHSPYYLIRSDSGLDGTGYTSIKHKDLFYIGTNQGLFFTKWDENWNAMQAAKFTMIPDTEGQVWSLNLVQGELFMGHHKGLFRVENNRAIPLPSPAGVWKMMPLSQDNELAILGTYDGLHLYQRRKGNVETWQRIKKLSGFDISARVMEQDKNGNIWVSHPYKGLYQIRLSSDLMAIDSLRFFNKENGLPGKLSINVAMVRDELVFTTPEGVFSYHEKKDSFYHHEELEKVLGEKQFVNRLIEDELGNIWFLLNSRFGMINIEEKGIFNDIMTRHFHFFQGELVDGFEHIFAMDEENIFIATEKGVVHFNPLYEGSEEFSFPTLIRNITSTAGEDTVLFHGNIPGINVLETSLPFYLPYSENALMIRYSASSYDQSAHLEYRIRLAGFDEEWSDWTNHSSKEYTNLDPGKYEFQVVARNAYGTEGVPARFSFTIAPPWYASPLAKVFWVLLAAILVTGIVVYLKKKAEREKEALRQEQAKELKKKESQFRQEAEKSEAEIERLKNEKLMASIHHKNSELASATMHLVHKNEVLVNIKIELKKLLAQKEIENPGAVKSIIRTIDDDIHLDDTWGQFKVHFDQVHEHFFKRLKEKFPELTPKDQKLCAYLRMNLSTKEIAPLLNISVRGVEISRYRLRKKLKLASETNLVDFILDL
jgi:DNA-binding CsgD family transcriptional regulator